VASAALAQMLAVTVLLVIASVMALVPVIAGGKR
jgi:hypothetical protein